MRSIILTFGLSENNNYYAKNIEYVLTNLGQCDIEVTANLLHNKIIAIDENFIFEVENKNY
mgnify:CR=1 FL=1